MSMINGCGDKGYWTTLLCTLCACIIVNFCVKPQIKIQTTFKQVKTINIIFDLKKKDLNDDKGKSNIIQTLSRIKCIT